MSTPFAWIAEEAERRRSAALDRSLNVRDAPGLVNFGSNDYLGLANDPRLLEAASDAMLRHGWGAGASPLVSGWTDIHENLARAIARFEGAERAVVFPTGYAANLGTVSALVDRGDAVYCDRLNHASLIDGAKLSGASLRVYPHNDADRLESILKRDRGRYRRSLIVTDGVFSMDGDLAPLVDLVEVAERWSAMLLVDEAHGTGVFGATGRGAAEFFGVADRVPIKVGTLSKAIGSIGGFAAGSASLIEHLINRARPLIYSTALPAAAAAASLVALRIIEEEPWRRLKVLALGDSLRSSLRGLGYEVGSGTGPIIPLMVGEADEALALASKLRDRRLFVPAIRPPTVPKGTSRLRISLTASSTEDELEMLLQSLKA